jgi:hypothetical protein
MIAKVQTDWLDFKRGLLGLEANERTRLEIRGTRDARNAGVAATTVDGGAATESVR